jgi:hypothetical protein
LATRPGAMLNLVAVAKLWVAGTQTLRLKYLLLVGRKGDI